jgi:hypothetical protein
MILMYAEQTNSGKEFVCFKRDWIRGLIFSYAGSDPRLFLGTIGPRLLNVRPRPTRRMYDATFHHIYNIFMAVFGVSLVLAVLSFGLAPFDLTAAWSSQGAGTSLVLMRTDVAAGVGDTVVGPSGPAGGVTMYTVKEVLRREGALQYRVADPSGVVGGALLTLSASELRRDVVLSVPFLGAWVMALDHPIGMMALLGLPLLMYVFNLGSIIGRKLLPVLHTLELEQGYGEGDTPHLRATTRERYGL